MPIDARAGRRVFWQAFGGGSVRGLLIHGALAQSGIWRDVAGALPLSSVAFDLPGHGRSADWSGDDYHGDCLAIAATFYNGPTHIVGHSFGATLALRLAILNPDFCCSLTLIEPVFFAAARADGAPELPAYDASMAAFVAGMEAGCPDAAARGFLGVWGDGTPWDMLPDRHRTSIARRMPLIVAGAPGIEGDSGNVLAPGAMQRLTAPVLLIRGKRSPPVIAAIHRGLTARLPDCREIVIGGAGHMVPLSHPEEVAGAIGGFL